MHTAWAILHAEGKSRRRAGSITRALLRVHLTTAAGCEGNPGREVDLFVLTISCSYLKMYENYYIVIIKSVAFTQRMKGVLRLFRLRLSFRLLSFRKQGSMI